MEVRYIAEWLSKWEPDNDGEFYVDDQVYDRKECKNLLEAAKVAFEKDESGRVIVEEQQMVDLEYRIYHWIEIEDYEAVSLIKGK